MQLSQLCDEKQKIPHFYTKGSFKTANSGIMPDSGD